MYYYRYKNEVIISNKSLDFEKISEKEAMLNTKKLFAATFMHPAFSRKSFCISHPDLLFLENEGIELLSKNKLSHFCISEWLKIKIKKKNVESINLNYPNWENVLSYSMPSKWNINLAGLGDVGGILLCGLKLFGGNIINRIGIYDIDNNKILRWIYEANQILSPDSKKINLFVEPVSIDEIFNCDMFIFCVSAGVPPIGEELIDVRMAQFKKNSEILKYYALKARESNFKGIFAILSDPVDLLCKEAFFASNRNEKGELDFKGLSAEQIRGYGLGVMNARAAFYASQLGYGDKYLNEGRVFGPHGKGLIVANSIQNYDDAVSLKLTELTLKANLDVRLCGYKPYIAPALSSGALSIISTIKGKWHYSSIPIGGIYMGVKNRLTAAGIEIERLDFPDKLFNRVKNTYKEMQLHE